MFWYNICLCTILLFTHAVPKQYFKHNPYFNRFNCINYNLILFCLVILSLSTIPKQIVNALLCSTLLNVKCVSWFQKFLPLFFFGNFLLNMLWTNLPPPLLPKFLYFLSLIPIKLLLNIPLFPLSDSIKLLLNIPLFPLFWFYQTIAKYPFISSLWFYQTVVKYPFISSLLILSNYC